MISKDNKLIQVKVSKNAYDFLHKYSFMFDISISRFCELAINNEIIKRGNILANQLVCCKCHSRISCTMNPLMCADVQDFYDEVKNV